MKVLGINHVGLAPKDPAKARWFFTEALGLSLDGQELVPSQMTNTVIIKSHSEGTPGDPEGLFEILENQEGTDGPVSKFIEKKGGGIHHLAITVDSVEQAIARMKELGVTMVDEEPRPGVCQTKIAFVHPKATGGLLIELVENP